MKSPISVTVSCFLLAGCMVAQQFPPQDFPVQLPTKRGAAAPSTDNAPPRSAESAGESSSKDTKIDITPPLGDAKAHPNSGVGEDALGIYSYNPHKAQKNIEVGDFYFKRENYAAAASRYQEALQWKPNDAEATFKLASALEKLGRLHDARLNYEQYLKVLPDGRQSKDARKALERLASTGGKPITEGSAAAETNAAKK